MTDLTAPTLLSCLAAVPALAAAWPAPRLERLRTLALALAGVPALLLSLWATDRPFAVDVTALAVLAWLVVATAPRGRLLLPWPPRELVPPIGAVLAAYALAAALSVNPAESWRVVAGLVLLLFIGQLAGNLLARGWPPVVLHRALLVLAVGLLAFLLATWLQDGAPLRWYRFRWETNNIMALYNVLALPALATGSGLALLLALPAVAYLSASRGGLLGAAGGLAVLAAGRGWRLPRWPVVLAAALLGGLMAWRLATTGHGGRAELWGTAGQMFAAAPLTGQGPGTYKAFWTARYPDAPRYGHAHNLPINILAETGLIGLAASAWLAASVLRLLWRRARQQQPWALGALAALIALGLQSVGDTPTTQGYISVAALVVSQLGLYQQEA